MVNGQTLAQCMLAVKVGWDSYLQVADTGEELPPILKSQGINVSGPSNDDDDKFIIVSFALRKGGREGESHTPTFSRKRLPSVSFCRMLYLSLDKLLLSLTLPLCTHSR